MRTLLKLVRINFFRTIGINKKFAAIQEVFIQEEWINFVRIVSLMASLPCLISIFPHLCGGLEDQEPIFIVKQNKNFYKVAWQPLVVQNDDGVPSKPHFQITVII